MGDRFTFIIVQEGTKGNWILHQRTEDHTHSHADYTTPDLERVTNTDTTIHSEKESEKESENESMM
jgi:hypothetical protein